MRFRSATVEEADSWLPTPRQEAPNDELFGRANSRRVTPRHPDIYLGRPLGPPTRIYRRVLAPGLAELDPRLPKDLAHRSDLAHAWRQLDRSLNQFTDKALAAA
jgi:hypothetical protein